MRLFRGCRNSIRLQSDIPELVKLWILRLLVKLGGQREFIAQNTFQEEPWAEALGVSEWIDGEECDCEPKAVRARLGQIYREHKCSFGQVALPALLTANIARLSALVGLPDTDCRILEFAVVIHDEYLLDEAADLLGNLSREKVFKILSVLLGIPEQSIRSALSAKGILASTGLLSLDNNHHSLKNKLNLLSRSFADIMLHSDADPITLLRDTVFQSKPATLCLEDFVHIKQEVKILLPYLKHAISSHRQGTNIFLYGIPGTGKSELSKLLAKEMQCELFEVTSEDEDGDPVHGDRRLRAFRAAQSFFGHQQMILFDEVEDVFNENNRWSRNSTGDNKAWINRILEDNKIPTIWVSNSVSCLDNAFIRRFDMVIEIPVPPKPQREQIVRQACRKLSLPVEKLLHIAKIEKLAPAIISRALSVVHCIREELGDQDIPSAVECLIGNTLQAQGYKLDKGIEYNSLPPIYDPTYINADIDILVVAEGLAKSKSGRLCLYGPPGTGKTAFGRWLAEKLLMPLSVKKASDILSKFVGDTEQNIAMVFHEAKEEGALLLIDEMDSFLQDRRRSQRSWELTQVNEMLVQMESFPGVFIASTNLMDGLDQAAFRRFDLKIKFDYLKPLQASALLERYCDLLGISLPSLNQKAKLTRLTELTPGDFALVARQHRFRPINTPAEFITALENECLLKEGNHRRVIGFI